MSNTVLSVDLSPMSGRDRGRSLNNHAASAGLAGLTQIAPDFTLAAR